MYSGYGFRDFEIGDVDVIKFNGLFHLFHLTLPNHAYIAHAVSKDGFKWKRVKNAVFISDPPTWDDDMLWTMHVSPNPYKPGSWRMFYTGLCMGDRSRIQRIGLALSDDLYNWEKSKSDSYPVEVKGMIYESSIKQGRHWVSFRDPFCYCEDEKVFLLAAGRVNKGPVIRRGCVALVEEKNENKFEFKPPLFQPMHYDDVEVPNLFKLNGRYYLIGSIREDVKVHYWWSDKFKGPYQNFADNVLLPQGNYAARISKEGERYLIWNFFFKGRTTKGKHLMAPPKELVVDENSELRLKTYKGFDNLVSHVQEFSKITPLKTLYNNSNASSKIKNLNFVIDCSSGFEAFLLKGIYKNFILTGELITEDRGKYGLVFRINREGDGYYLSLDFFKGIVQLRAWGRNPHGEVEEAFTYRQLQVANYIPKEGPHPFCLIAYDQYLEFSLNGYILLTLADDQYEKGNLGFYIENARLRINNPKLKICGKLKANNYPKHIPNF